MKIILALILSSIIFTGCGNESNKSAKNNQRINDIEVEQMRQLIISQPGIILDVRTPKEVAEGYIDQAQNIDIMSSNFMTQINILDKDKPIYVYCKKGGRSANASEKLAREGFTKVYNLMGGFDAWKAAELPIKK